MNMSDPATRIPIVALSAPSGFRPDARFSRDSASPAEQPAESVEEDAFKEAFAKGFEAGIADEHARAAQAAAAESQARQKLALSFARIDKQQEELLRLRLRDTVAALCEAAILPLALDQDGLVKRIDKAVSMLTRADDKTVIRLHPDDIQMVSPQLQADWTVEPDPTLERGSLRVECASGGVEDGPATWRRAIAEALHQC